MEHVIVGKFKLGRKIGSGSFEELYLGMVISVNVHGGEEVAVKLVWDRSSNLRFNSDVWFMAKYLQALYSFVPDCKWAASLMY
ncbi:hypothetical protein DVH24_010749 [Malus domestica]|uniref:Protein kinase domain-containing protein n=1 Tax=Malus domestica TaxID=3750 RepID=A0A498JXB7_MALDO|nr:hypothetical protein DVH24_010749 [Malus domestica]